ncbi:MAG: hypothetical protein AAGF11_54710 [Myxococcota bacterium]
MYRFDGTLLSGVADWKKIFDDAVDQIGEAATAAGEGLRQAAGEAGKVVGIGVGSIELRVDGGTSHRLGARITGTVALTLAEPVPAKGLTVTLQATRRRRVLVEDHRRGRRTAMRNEVIYEFVGEVGGEQTYASGEHAFAVELPLTIEVPVEVDGLLGDALRAVRTVQAMTERPIRWQLVATLVIPWKRNLSKAIDLAVRDASEGPSSQPPKSKPRTPETPKQDKAKQEKAKQEKAQQEKAKQDKAKQQPPRSSKQASAAGGVASSPSPASRPESSCSRPPLVVPEPIAVPQGWGVALQRLMAQMLGQGWETIHQWGPPPVDPTVVRDALARHPDLDPEILMFYSMMDGIELVFGKPAAPRHEYETIRRARELVARSGGSIGGLDELWSHAVLGVPLTAEFSPDRGGQVRVLEIPSLARLLDDREDFATYDGRTVVLGRIVLGDGDDFGIVRADEIRRWRSPARGAPNSSGPYDVHARGYQQCLQTREQQRPGAWWVVRGQDHGVRLWEPPVLLRWSEMLAVCLRHLETGTA